MVQDDDPFLGCLRSLSGQTVRHLVGDDGLDGAVAGLALFELCRRFGVECLPHGAEHEAADAVVILGAGREGALGGRDSARLLGRNRVVLAPCSFAGFEEIADYRDRDVALFCRDQASLKMALMQGIEAARVRLCRDLAVHLDVGALASTDIPGRGVLTVATGARPAGPTDDALDLRSAGEGGRWATETACRGAVRGAAELMSLYAEVRTDSPSVAILAARLGKKVRLSRDAGGVNEGVFEASIGPLFVGVALDPAGAGDERGPDLSTAGGGAPDERCDVLERELRDARRDVELLRQAGDFRFASALAERLDADGARAAAVLAEEMGGDAAQPGRRPRLVPIAEVERAADEVERAHEARRIEVERDHAARLQAAERASAERLAAAVAEAAEAAQKREAAKAAQEREAAKAAQEREAEVGELQGRLSAAQLARGHAEQRIGAEAARHLAEARSLRDSLAALERAVASKSQTILSLQASLDDREALRRTAETRNDLMRALIDSRSAAAEAGRRDADEARRRLDAVLASRGWRALPLRAVGRGFRGLGGDAP